MKMRTALACVAICALLGVGCAVGSVEDLSNSNAGQGQADTGGGTATGGTGGTMQGGTGGTTPGGTGGTTPGGTGGTTPGGTGGTTPGGTGGTTPGGTGGTTPAAQCGGAACSAPKACCSDMCVDTKTDPANCGACGMICDAPSTCVASVCKCPNAGEVLCNGACIAVNGMDNNNCGACGKVCMGTTTCCKGICADVTRDKNNCGMCGKVCASNSNACTASVCKCGTAPACTAAGALVCNPFSVCFAF